MCVMIANQQFKEMEYMNQELGKLVKSLRGNSISDEQKARLEAIWKRNNQMLSNVQKI